MRRNPPTMTIPLSGAIANAKRYWETERAIRSLRRLAQDWQIAASRAARMGAPVAGLYFEKHAAQVLRRLPKEPKAQKARRNAP